MRGARRGQGAPRKAAYSSGPEHVQILDLEVNKDAAEGPAVSFFSRLTREGAATEAASSHDQTADCMDQVALASACDMSDAGAGK